MRVILASGSPRRRELLKGLGLTFDVLPADIDETPRADESPEALVCRLSRSKARVMAQAHPDALVIAADTVVVLDGEILNKPQDRAENHAFISRLSGVTHTVFTGHTLAIGEREVSKAVQTGVRFRDLSEDEIGWYAATGEGLDKAGGYAIQGYGSAIVEEIHGCYFNVVGLSVAQVVMMARSLGVPLV